MTAGQYEQYAAQAAADLELYPPDVERVVKLVGPRIAEDTRDRLVAAAGEAVEREVCESAAAWEATLRRLVNAELKFYGYNDEQLALANKARPHTDDCEFDWNSSAWECSDENGKSFHPEWDEATDVAGTIGRALEALEWKP